MNQLVSTMKAAYQFVTAGELAEARAARQRDRLIAALVFAGALGLYSATLLPGIGGGDTAEFQRVLPTLGVAHPTGYPLYTILGWLWSWLPVGTPAWRISLFSALAGALAAGVVYCIARAIGQARGAAAAAALALATARAFWSQATIAEVYTLAALIQALLLLALLRWRAGRWPLWSVGLLLGLGLAHHRTIVLMLPGALIFVALSAFRRGREANPSAGGLAASARELALALLALLPGCLLYLYLPLRAPAWLDSWQAFARFVAGSDALAAWLHVAEPWSVAREHARELVTRLIWPQFLPAGALLALAGMARLWLRDRALAALLAAGYLLTLVFCVLFFVQDVEVFMIGAHLLAALLIGEGAMLLAASARQAWHMWNGRVDRRAGSVFAGLTWLLLLLPLLLIGRNFSAIQAANSATLDLAARALLAQPLPAGALLIVDWESVEGLRYLQAIEGRRRDLEVRPLNESVVRQDVDAALAAGRATYLLRAQPSLGLAQRPEGRLWRVGDQPIQLAPATPADWRWQDGLTLKGYSLAAGPYQPGEIVPVTLAWQARGSARQRYTMFVHLVGMDGHVWGQHDREPQPIPTDQWLDGARIVDLYGPTLALDTPPGRYHVIVGWYSYPSLVRLPGEDGTDALVLGQIEVAPLR